MRISCHNTFFEVSNVDYSPLLRTLRDTNVGTDRDENDILILDLDPEHFKQYIFFLEGKDFHMDEEIEELFDYMGHSNEMRYPLDYWRVKLRDNWIRDNFHRLELWRDPYYGLIEIPIENSLPLQDIRLDDMYIAGGAAMYMAGWIQDYGDIDIFTTNKDTATRWMKNYGDTPKDEYTMSTIIHKRVIQLILRDYKYPSEILYGFDLDCVGVMWDGKKLYATEIAYYSWKNKVNWFDHRRVSSSYIHRLCKYMNRGFHISLPLLTEEMINQKELDLYWKTMKPLVIEHLYKNRIRPCPPALPRRMDTLCNYIDVVSNYKVLSLYEKALKSAFITVSEHRNRVEDVEKEYICSYRRDDVSILLLASLYGFYVPSKCDDYRNLWTNQPHTIDLKQWYKQSPFIIRHQDGN